MLENVTYNVNRPISNTYHETETHRYAINWKNRYYNNFSYISFICSRVPVIEVVFSRHIKIFASYFRLCNIAGCPLGAFYLRHNVTLVRFYFLNRNST